MHSMRLMPELARDVHHAWRSPYVQQIVSERLWFERIPRCHRFSSSILGSGVDERDAVLQCSRCEHGVIQEHGVKHRSRDLVHLAYTRFWQSVCGWMVRR